MCPDLRPEPFGLGLPGSGPVTIGIRPQNLKLDPGDAGHTVDFAERLGGITYVHCSGPSGRSMTVEVHGDSALEAGTKTGICMDETDLLAFEREHGTRLRPG